MEPLNVIFYRLSRLPKNIELDFRNGDVYKNGVVVTRVAITPEGLSNFLKAVKLGLI